MKKTIPTRITKYCLPGVTLTPREGYYQVRKIGLSAERVRNDPLFTNTRKQAAQFSGALNRAHQLQAILSQLTGVKGLAPRLVGMVRKPAVHQGLGEEGIDLNPHAPWKESVSYIPYYRYSHQLQQWTIHIPTHVPAMVLNAPPGTTHYRVIASLIHGDETGRIYNSVSVRSSIWPVKHITIRPTVLKHPGGAREGHQHWIFVYIQWYFSDKSSVALRKSTIPGPLICPCPINY